MPKFRSIPEIVEAARFDPCGAHRLKLPEGVKGRLTCPYENHCQKDWSCPCCMFWMPLANDRWISIRAGDWIVHEGDHVNRRADRGDGLAPLGYEPVEAEAASSACYGCGGPGSRADMHYCDECCNCSYSLNNGVT